MYIEWNSLWRHIGYKRKLHRKLPNTIDSWFYAIIWKMEGDQTDNSAGFSYICNKISRRYQNETITAGDRQISDSDNTP